jgi:hypothetical protein
MSDVSNMISGLRIKSERFWLPNSESRLLVVEEMSLKQQWMIIQNTLKRQNQESRIDQTESEALENLSKIKTSTCLKLQVSHLEPQCPRLGQELKEVDMQKSMIHKWDA